VANAKLIVDLSRAPYCCHSLIAKHQVSDLCQQNCGKTEVSFASPAFLRNLLESMKLFLQYNQKIHPVLHALYVFILYPDDTELRDTESDRKVAVLGVWGGKGWEPKNRQHIKSDVQS
jgi:hypothetical protein